MKDNIQALKIVQDFITEMNTQDNRRTARPYFYVIRTAHWVSSYHEGEGDRVILIHDCDETCGTAECEEDLFEEFRKEYDSGDEEEDKKIKEMDDWDLKNWFDDNEYYMFWEKREWEERNCFLTDTEAREHLRLNHYHYSKDAHTYVKHFWRAPKVKEFFTAVGELCGVEYNNR